MKQFERKRAQYGLKPEADNRFKMFSYVLMWARHKDGLAINSWIILNTRSWLISRHVYEARTRNVSEIVWSGIPVRSCGQDSKKSFIFIRES